MIINWFDQTVIAFLNGFAQQSQLFDELVLRLNGNDLVKGGMIVATFWWLWFKHDQESSEGTVRASVLATLFGALTAVFLARACQLLLPFRPRPIHNPDFSLILPYGSDVSVLDSWSSFPSDHGALFFGMVVGLTWISKRLGMLSFLYVLAFITFPRIYSGMHYPSDMIAGSLIGIACLIGNMLVLTKYDFTKPVFIWAERHPPSFYACFFLFTFQVTTLFDGARKVAGFFVKNLVNL